MDDLEHAIDELVRSGYDTYFHADGEHVGCPGCDHLVHVDELSIDRIARLPLPFDDEMLVFAVSNGPCGRRGLFTTARSWTINDDARTAERALRRRLDT
jgi:hypothetical protein